ncbi:hypothetical protein BJY21_001445 [Kineosphaera limosa]|uniref:Lipoprotein n=1 Tax=Kineosphaera limosa NBRC 100340 TaxID=1184609 RepID=K6XH44_9MICO|nr:hypothetical protein [Kineosphaera limosa]NYE00261.1 hypothetical protein [Kineosphaera limosa]GAB98164.1 hypothetical protein KILIM_107_00090 [Kineosphaera limosa NBRC 100340]
MTARRRLPLIASTWATITLLAACTLESDVPELRFEVDPPPNGASGIVRDAAATWTFGIPNLCLNTPGSITIREVRLAPPNELVLVRFGVREIAADMGVGAVQEPMADYGYRTAPEPATITGTCPTISSPRPSEPQGDTREGSTSKISTWSLAVELKPTGAHLSGRITELTVIYGAANSDNAGPTRKMTIPMTLRLCTPTEGGPECLEPGAARALG